jgi:trehalose 6-phosphate synthase
VASRRRLIVVSNRGPVGYSRDDGGDRVARRGGGGLVTALRGLVSRHDVTWIASAITPEDRAVAAEGAFDETLDGGAPFRLRLVAHDENEYDWHYNVVSNPTLWFLQHYLWDLRYEPQLDAGFVNAWEHGYVRVNERFAGAVIDELAEQPDAAVFFHDYHLYLAPRLVRDRAPDATLVHFVHIPWAQPDSWRVLPERIRRLVHDGLLANDVVGFHTSRWRRNFLRSCEDIVGAEYDRRSSVAEYDGRQTRVAATAISVDPAEFDALATSDAVVAAEQRLLEERCEHLILRVDRTDPSKNIVRGFRAYELLLQAHPDLVGRVQMLALLDPSRQDIPEYAEYLGAIQRAARAVNDRFREDGWEPLVLRIEDDFAASVAAYKQYDVLLVNAIFDGLNLVAKEAPLVNQRDGVLVLSENAGVHEELGEWALTVNPFDVEGQAQALHTALTMPAAQRRSRLERIRAHVRTHDLAAWLEAQLEPLVEDRARRLRPLARLRRR